MSGLPTPPPTQLMQDAHAILADTTGPTRNERYYNTTVPDPIIIQVEDCLYRQSYHYLSTHIRFLTDMVGLPPPPEGHEGSDDTNPLHFTGVSNETFEQVLSIIYLSVYSDTYESKMTLDEILNILAFCRHWDVPSAQGYCLEYLDRAIEQGRLHPMLVFAVGRKFDRVRWLRDALNELQHLPAISWVDNPQILSWVSPHDVLIVLRLREYVHTYRLEFARFRPPAVHAVGCQDPDQCSFLWEISWALTVVPRIAHESCGPSELIQFVQGLEVEGMGKGCAEASRNDALRSDRFYMHNEGVNKALQLI